MDYFITQNYLVSNSPITQNVSAKDIIPFVGTSSEMYVQPLLGSYFYNHILSAYNAQTLNADEITLVEKIQPVVAWRAAADAVYALTYQLKNKGLSTQNGENSEPAEAEQVVMMKRHYDQKAEFYQKRLVQHLILNKDKFTEFTADANTDSEVVDMIPNDDAGYNNDMLMI